MKYATRAAPVSEERDPDAEDEAGGGELDRGQDPPVPSRESDTVQAVANGVMELSRPGGNLVTR
jgi:hypothetical protein